MSDEERLAIRQVSDAAVSVQVILYAHRDGRNPVDEFRRLRMTDELSGEFVRLARDYARLLHDNWHELPFDPGFEPHDGQVARLDTVVEEAAAIRQLRQRSLAATDIAQLDGLTDRFLDNVQYYAVVLSDDEHTVTFVRKFKKSMRLLRNGGLHLVLSQNTFAKLEAETFRFDERFDCCVADGVCFISWNGVNDFLSMFKILDQYRVQAGAVVDQFGAAIPISGLEEFKQAATSDVRIMKAMIAARGNVERLALVPLAEIQEKAAMLGLNGLVIQDPDDGQLKLVFDPSPKTRWHLPHLLNDSYVMSMLLEGQYYEAPNKRRLS